MYKMCKTEQSAKRQRKIEEALLDLMIEQPYKEISITELCERMQIPRKAFYRYFDSRDGALLGLVEHTLGDFQSYAAAMRSPTRSLQTEMEQFFAFWKERKRFLDGIVKNDLSGILVDVSMRYPVGTMVNLARFLPSDPEPMRLPIFRFAVTGLLSYMLDWYRTGFAQSVTEMANGAIRMLCHPLFSALVEMGFQA